MIVSPLAGYFSQRVGSRWFMTAGLALQAVALGWLALLTSVHTSYVSMIAPFILAGSGMALVFAPVASAVLDAVSPEEAGQASGATNTIREVGGVLGIAVLATVFTSHGSYISPASFVHGLQPAMWVGVAVLAAGALLAGLLPLGERAGSGTARPVELASVTA
jgi:MFS family permease